CRLGAEGASDVDVGNGDEGIFEVAAVRQEVIGKVALCPDQRDAGADVRPRQAGQSRRAEVDGGAVGAGPGGSDAGAAHGTRVVLVDAKTLPSEAGGDGGDKRSSTGEEHQRKPPHTRSPKAN